MTEEEDKFGVLISRRSLPEASGIDTFEARVITVQEVPLKKKIGFFIVRGNTREQLSAIAAQALLRDLIPRKPPHEMSEIELWTEISVLRGECDRMRPIYEAAKALRPVHDEKAKRQMCPKYAKENNLQPSQCNCGLCVAVNAAVAEEVSR